MKCNFHMGELTSHHRISNLLHVLSQISIYGNQWNQMQERLFNYMSRFTILWWMFGCDESPLAIQPIFLTGKFQGEESIVEIQLKAEVDSNYDHHESFGVPGTSNGINIWECFIVWQYDKWRTGHNIFDVLINGDTFSKFVLFGRWNETVLFGRWNLSPFDYWVPNIIMRRNNKTWLYFCDRAQYFQKGHWESLLSSQEKALGPPLSHHLSSSWCHLYSVCWCGIW